MLESNGIDASAGMELQLMLLDGLEPTDEAIEYLQQDNYLGSELAKMGFVIVEASTLKPIVVLIDNNVSTTNTSSPT